MAVLAFINAHFPEIMAIFFGGAAIQAVVSHVQGRKLERQFAEQSGVPRFRERGASGRRKRPFTLSGASRVLDVVVTDRELWIKGIWPIFTYYGSRGGITHKVPLTNIKRVSANGQKVDLLFTDASGAECQIELHLRDPRMFVSAVVPSA